MGKVVDKLLLFIYSVVVAVVACVVLFVAFDWADQQDATSLVLRISEQSAERITAIAVSIVVLLISFRFLYISLRRDRSSLPSIDQRTEFGDIRISLETVENLSLKAASRVRGVKDLKSRIRISDAGIDIMIRAIVDGESSIPLLTEEVQKSVKNHIEDITGIPVSTVTVFVANIIQSQTFKSRVE